MKQQLFVRFLPAAALLLLLSGCWFTSDTPEDTGAQEPPSVLSEQEGRQENTPIVFEEPASGSHEEPVHPPTQDEKKTVPDSRPRVAIIIDDMGYHRKIGEGLLALDLDLSFAFLPMAPFTTELETKAYEQGRDIMLHLPMEAGDKRWDPGPGALFLSASPEEMVTILQKDMAAVPHAVGTNNHMGSKFTEDRQAMHTVLGEIQRQGMFFVDSFTTAGSTGLDEARKMGIPTNRRHVFLDNVQKRNKICDQLDKLAALAVRQHQAIGIGHPYQATLDALRQCGDRLEKTVRIVPVHELVE
jgi:polysaccharide deacetylase 2 family uncharacterized protein YibQ